MNKGSSIMSLWQVVSNLSIITCGLFFALEEVTTSADSQFDVVAKRKLFIDRSLGIELIFPYKNSRVVLAPSKFGKTTILSMMKQFMEVCVDETGKVKTPNTTQYYSLFKGLQIGQRPFFQDHFAMHPVIYLDLAEFVVTGSAEEFKRSFQKVARRLLTEHKYLLQSESLEAKSRKQLKDDVDQILSEQKAAFSDWFFARKLSEKMREHFKQKVIVLIDGIDAPAMSIIESNNARVQEVFMRDTADFVSNLVERNPDNVFGVLATGVTVHGLGIFDDPKFTIYDALNSELRYYYGVTEDQVQQLLSVAGLPQSQEQVVNLREMYGGYRLSHPLIHNAKDVYNPQSILKFCEEKVVKPYWEIAPTIQPIRKLLLSWNFGSVLERAFYKDVPITASSFETEVTNFIELHDFLVGNASHVPGLWSTGGYLYESGLFTIQESHSRTNITVTVPNNEVRRGLLDLVLDKDYYKLKHNITETLIHSFVQSVAQLNSNEASFEHLADCIVRLFGNEEKITEQSSFRFLLYSYLRQVNEDLLRDVNVEVGPEVEREVDLVVTRKDGSVVVWGLTVGEESGLDALKKILGQKRFQGFPKSNLIHIGVNILKTGERCHLSYLHQDDKIENARSVTRPQVSKGIK